MRARLAIAILLIAAVPAFAQNAEGPESLRPSIQADGPPRSAQTTTPPPPPAAATPPAPMLSPVPQPPTAEQCRTTCAQDYYFCLAENEVQDCAPAWSQCRVRCSKAAGAR